MQDEIPQIGHQRQTRGPEPRVVGHHEHVGKEAIDGGAQAGDLRECGPVVAAADRGFDAWTPGVEGVEQRALRRLDERRRDLDWRAALATPSRCSSRA